MHSALFIIAGRPHVRIDGGAEGGEGDAAARDGLGAGVLGQDPAGEAARRDAVGEVVLGADALDAALDAGEEGADLAEVPGRGPGPRAHVLEADLELLAEREGGHRGLRAAWGAVGSVVCHLERGGLVMDLEGFKRRLGRGTYGGHEHAEDTTHAETHDAGHDGLAEA